MKPIDTNLMFTDPAAFNAEETRRRQVRDKTRERNRRKYLREAQVDVRITNGVITLHGVNDVARGAPLHDTRARVFRSAGLNPLNPVVGGRRRKWEFDMGDAYVVAKTLEKVYGFCPEALLPFRCQGMEYTGPHAPFEWPSLTSSGPVTPSYSGTSNDRSDPSGKIAMICLGGAVILMLLIAVTN